MKKYTEFERQEYFKKLEERQKAHLGAIHNRVNNWQPCLHDQCQQCHGTGSKLDGTSCIHNLSCPCPRCTPTC